jgi:selenide,water dikinase
VDDQEPKYGLSVTGVIDPRKVVSNQGARVGDCLYITKPLGTGIVTTAIKGEMATAQTVREAVRSMSTLNKAAREVMMEVGVNAATDITGFGLLGHTMEMAVGSRVQIELWADRLPLLKGVEELAAMGLIPAGTYANRDYLQGRVEVAKEVDNTRLDIMYTPETSGGLLLAVDAARRHKLEQLARSRSVGLTMIGRVLSGGTGYIKVSRGEK